MASGDFSIGGKVWPGISKLVEETGEVQQVCGKLIANEGRADHWDGTNLVDRMTEEMGDLLAAINFVIDVNRLNLTAIQERRDDKLRLFHGWHASRA